MRNYRIAYFTVDWNFDLVDSSLHGLKRYVDDHENVRLCVFDCFGKDQNNAKDRSEYAIFDLPDLDDFDGLLIQGNQIVLEPIRDALARKVAATGIPAVTIDCPIAGCAMLGIDNRAAQHDIAQHVIQVHGARRLVYLTGILDTPECEGVQRLDGLRNACRESGLAPEDVEVIQCTWRPQDGRQVGERWCAEKLPLPDAFICANDEMALGLIESLQKHGLTIPDDVRVVGFDNISAAELSTPRLSTVQRDYDRMNYTAMEFLIARIDGRDDRLHAPFGYELICSESCGCREDVPPAYYKDKYYQQNRLLRSFFLQQEQMAEELFNASDMKSLMQIVERNYGIFACDNIYLCINDYYYDNYDKKQWSQDSERFGREMVLAACGHSEANADDALRLSRFPSRCLLPEALMASKRFLIFYPLHYNTYSIGYLVMDSISEMARLNLHESIFSFLEIAIENVRKKCLLYQLNNVLDDLYVHDALTGLYNRFGYERFARLTFDAHMRVDGGAQVLFVDMDDMKGVNDRYGHEAGDASIRVAARILKDACDPKDFIMRYGGDEFLIIASQRESGLAGDIERAARSGRYAEPLPRPLSLTVGAIQVDAQDAMTLDACIQAADARMYEIKSLKKAGNA